MEKTYIGDGVYASNDGYAVCLETDRRLQREEMDKIYLDLGMILNLHRYIEKEFNVKITMERIKNGNNNS